MRRQTNPRQGTQGRPLTQYTDASTQSYAQSDDRSRAPSLRSYPHASPRPGGAADPGATQQIHEDPPFYLENIPPLNNRIVAELPWIRFLTLVSEGGGKYRPRSTSPAASGGFSDVWVCDSRFKCGWDVVVAVKKLRGVHIPSWRSERATKKRLIKRLKNELKIWKDLAHPNVVPLLGYTCNKEIALISPWFNHGSILFYVKSRNLDVEQRMGLIRGVSSGLEYLHSRNPLIVHGDLKPDNILIDKYERPRIIDFGLSKFVQEGQISSSTTSSSVPGAGNYRFGPPELFLDPIPPPSSHMDMFSWASVAFFIFTGDEPFKDILSPQQLVIRRSQGAKPIPAGVTYHDLDSTVPLKEALLSCWKIQPEERPNIRKVVRDLGPSQSHSKKPSDTTTVADPEIASIRSSDSNTPIQELPGNFGLGAVAEQRDAEFSDPDMHNPDLLESIRHAPGRKRPGLKPAMSSSQLPEIAGPTTALQVDYRTSPSVSRHEKEPTGDKTGAKRLKRLGLKKFWAACRRIWLGLVRTEGKVGTSI